MNLIAVDITNNLHKEFGKTVSLKAWEVVAKIYPLHFVVCSEDTGPACFTAETGREGVWEAEGVHGQPSPLS